MRAAELARQDFAQALGASAGRAGALHARPIGLVVCDEGEDALRAARHLVDDVEVPAVIGFRSTPLRRPDPDRLSAQSRALACLDQPGPRDHEDPRAGRRAAPRLALDAEHRRQPCRSRTSSRTSSSPLPVRGARDWRATLQGGGGLAEGTNSTSLIGALRGPTLQRTERARERDELSSVRLRRELGRRGGGRGRCPASLCPTVIVYTGAGFFSRVFAPLEARWTGAIRPFYLTESSIGHNELAFAGHDPSRRRRLLSNTNLSTTMTNAQLVLRYNLAYPDDPIVRSEAPQPSYDAFYILAYATYALGDGAVSGPALSVAIDRLLPPGRTVDVGPAQIFEAFESYVPPDERAHRPQRRDRCARLRSRDRRSAH